jgi:hypothetical protein
VKTYLRQPQLAKRYATTIRTIQRMRQNGRIPAPDTFSGPHPLWATETLDASDRAAALRAPPPKTINISNESEPAS